MWKKNFKVTSLKILAVHRYYWPDTPPYATMLRRIVSKWRETGHHVEVLSSQPSYKSGLKNEPRPCQDQVDDTPVFRLNLPNESRRPILRIFNALRLSLILLQKAILGRYDVIMISTAPPVLGGVAASIASKLTGARLIYHCMDIHPEIGKISGEFSSALVFKTLLKLDCWTCQRADPVIVLSKDMERTLRLRPGGDRFSIKVLNNFGLPEEKILPEALPFEWPSAAFTLLFAGNLGRFQGLDTLVEAMGKLRHRQDVEAVILGDGVTKHSLQMSAKELGARIRFVGHQPVEVAKAAMLKADVCFVSLTLDIYRYAYPSKTMTYLEQGCPLVVAIEPESELALDVTKGGYGYTVAPGECEALAVLLERIADMEGGTTRLRQKAKAKAKQVFSENIVLQQWEDLLQKGAKEEVAIRNVVIAGAPRSGTNMLRDVLCTFDGIATWPCDEINYIWRHGNMRYPSDEIPADRVTLAIQTYVRKQFEWVARKYQAHTVVEKTCANSLRIPFVDRILPEAKYIYIYRNGLDTTRSASLCWTASLDIPYLLKKVRFVPLMDLPYYGGRYLRSHLYRLFSCEKRLAFWGPALDDMQSVLAQYSLNEICALQWQRCVENSEASFAKMPGDRVIRVCYEDFVQNPGDELKRVLAFMGVQASDKQVKVAVSGVSGRSVGKGRAAFSDDELAKLESLVGSTLDRYDYRN